MIVIDNSQQAAAVASGSISLVEQHTDAQFTLQNKPTTSERLGGSGNQGTGQHHTTRHTLTPSGRHDGISRANCAHHQPD